MNFWVAKCYLCGQAKQLYIKPKNNTGSSNSDVGGFLVAVVVTNSNAVVKVCGVNKTIL